MIDIIDVLQNYAPLSHWTIIPARGGPDADLATPPMVWWTLAARAEDGVAVLREAVDSFQGAFAWELACVAPPDDTNGGRWSLMPARLRQHADFHGCQGVMLAAKALKANDPTFGQRANAELPHLAAHLRDMLLRASDAGHLEGASK